MNVFDFLTEIQKRKKREVYSSELGAVATDLKNPQKKYTIINMMLGAKYILTPLKYKRHGQKVDCYSKRNLGDSPPPSHPSSRACYGRKDIGILFRATFSRRIA